MQDHKLKPGWVPAKWRDLRGPALATKLRLREDWNELLNIEKDTP